MQEANKHELVLSLAGCLGNAHKTSMVHHHITIRSAIRLAIKSAKIKSGNCSHWRHLGRRIFLCMWKCQLFQSFWKEIWIKIHHREEQVTAEWDTHIILPVVTLLVLVKDRKQQKCPQEANNYAHYGPHIL